MQKKRTEIIIPKDRAIFWLDKNGRWHNAHGEFEHKKIIDYFHSSIKRDENGYYLFQKRGDIQEKVYFHYEDTALFAVPRNLFIRGDDLYMRMGEETIKFAERGLMKISDLLEYDNDQYFIKINNRKYKILQKAYL
jgi:hypothetical protein